MKSELNDKLVAKYQYMFLNTENEPIYAWGFEHDDGWYNLIDNYLAEIQANDPKKEVKIIQAKEKFATIRLYYSGLDFDKMCEIDKKYYKISAETCEICGEPGVICKNEHWYKTLCINHRNYNNSIYQPIKEENEENNE